MTVTVNTKPYEWEHGKKPKGQGFWAFHIGEENGEEPIPAFIPGYYSEVKRKVVEHAKQLGESEVKVLP